MVAAHHLYGVRCCVVPASLWRLTQHLVSSHIAGTTALYHRAPAAPNSLCGCQPCATSTEEANGVHGSVVSSSLATFNLLLHTNDWVIPWAI